MNARALLSIALVTAALALSGCRGRPASAEDCRAILDRLIEIELAESGFRDPVLAQRWRRTLQQQLAPQLGGCQRKRVPPELRACLAEARTQEEITHRCLR
ncbi:MAG TPA: hypothetical protein VMU50_23670 [Polyangia bacterium]|nr:hypothetical protein [Polyangia bacterium]